MAPGKQGLVTVVKSPSLVSGIAKTVAKNFENLDCVRCADALVDAFKSEGITGQIITLQSKQTKRGFIWSTSADKIIATSGMHRGVLVDGKVYDNIHKSGIDLNDWINDFDVLGGFEIPSISSF